MDNVLAVFAAIGQLMKIKFGLRFEEVTGDHLLNFVETTLAGMAQTPYQKAQGEYYLAQLKAIQAKMVPLMAIAQPSSQEQAEIAAYEVKLQNLQQQLQAA